MENAKKQLYTLLNAEFPFTTDFDVANLAELWYMISNVIKCLLKFLEACDNSGTYDRAVIELLEVIDGFDAHNAPIQELLFIYTKTVIVRNNYAENAPFTENEELLFQLCELNLPQDNDQ